MAEVVKEDKRLTHDSDSCGYYHGYQVAEPVFSMSLHLAISFLLDKRQPRPRH
jgi:hypothetical protein